MQTIFPYVLISPEVTNESRHVVRVRAMFVPCSCHVRVMFVSSFTFLFLFFLRLNKRVVILFCSDIFILFTNKKPALN